MQMFILLGCNAQHEETHIIPLFLVIDGSVDRNQLWEGGMEEGKTFGNLSLQMYTGIFNTG